MSKNMRILILFYMFVNPSFKMKKGFENVAKLAVNLFKVNLYTRKDFKSSGTGSLYI